MLLKVVYNKRKVLFMPAFKNNPLGECFCRLGGKKHPEWTTISVTFAALS